MRKLSLIIILYILLIYRCDAQILIINNAHSGRNSAQSEKLYKEVDELTSKIVLALESKDTDKAQYYFNYWADELGAEAINVNFYLLRGQMYEIVGNYDAAKRAYNRAYKKYGCYECQEKLKNLPKN